MAVKKETPKAEVPAVASDKPSYLAEFEKKGPIQDSSNFDSSDVTIPRLKLIQAMSKEPETFNDAKPGTFWHTGMDLALGTEIDFVPVSRRKKYLLVAPIDDVRGILARSEDFIHWQPPQGEFTIKVKGRKITWTLAPTVAESGLNKWGSYNPEDDRSPPAATLFYEYLIVLPSRMNLGPLVLSLTRSQIKRAKRGLNDKISLHESAGRPMQSLVFKAQVIKEEGEAGMFYNWQFTSNGFAPEAIFKQAREMKDVLKTFKVRDEEDQAREDETSVDKNDNVSY